ncbi:Uma2 family endonuclease [Streptomyces stackebrandtii]|uniref:Uma2 family endonuclease n=1 Tax=Streptomyces stackebrandtii TaxID=3051177 RepID=UPI0028DB009E|nr:Uma2 family endonuclease [Streptomyces sp. DSM 40976]
MTAMPHEPFTPADVVLEGFLALETPEGFRAELIEGEIVVTPPPGAPRDHVIPDGTFAPQARRLYRGAEPWMPCAGVAMVLEVTSSRPNADREVKRRCYARGGIPLYLLVDRDTSTVTLFTDAESGDYRELHAVPFGKTLSLPEPFGFDLETADFL